jgi:hypothetical protein
MELYPRQFLIDAKYGWTVWTVKINGFILDHVLKNTLNTTVPFTVSGITYRIVVEGGKRKVKDLKVNGKGFSAFKSYSIAVPEGIGRGRAEIITFHKLIEKLITHPKDTKIPIWTALENKMRAMGTISRPQLRKAWGQTNLSEVPMPKLSAEDSQPCR